MRFSVARTLWLALGIVSLGLGIVGAFVPLLPTTPLVLLAGYCFSRSSERLHRWLVNHPWLGKLIRDWNQHGVIQPKAKWLASAMIATSLGFLALRDRPHWGIRLGVMVFLLGVLGFILSRPSRPKHLA